MQTTAHSTKTPVRDRLKAYGLAARAAFVADARAAPRWLRWAAAIWLALIAAMVIFLIVFDWNWARGPISRFASAQLNRTVAIEGDLDVHPWSFSPRAEAHGLKIGQPAWARKPGQPDQMASAARLAVQIKVLPLLRGKVVMPLVHIDRPNLALYRQADGQANWQFGDPNKPKRPLKLPAIQRFIINDGQVRYVDDARRMTFEGRVSSREQAGGDGRGRFELTGDGRLNGAVFTALVTGGPLLNISPDRPYPLTADIRAGSTTLLAKGQIDRPFDLGRFGAQLDIRGADLNNLYYLTGLSLPNTPPYRVQGALARRGMLYTFNRFTGRVGDSDVGGDLSVDVSGERPLLKGAVVSKRLDFDDLGSIVGLPKTAVRDTASVGQKVEATLAANRGLLLPDATLQVERIRAMDAEVTYRAETVNAPGLPLRKLAIDVDLKDGVLNLDPLSFTFSRGDLAGRVRLNAQGEVPVTDADLRLTNGRLEDLITVRNEGQPVIEGAVAARIRLTGTGNSLHRAASSSNGAMTVVIPRGEIRQAFAELLGINASKALLLLLSEDTRSTALRCGIADFKVVNGVMTLEKGVFDTGVVLASASGRINLKTETMDMRIEGKSKKTRLVRLIAPITLEGPIAKPDIGVEPGTAVAQGGLGLALGTLLTPLAAILPFVDAGLAKNADCAALMNEARSGTAAVRTTVATTPAAPAKK